MELFDDRRFYGVSQAWHPRGHIEDHYTQELIARRRVYAPPGPSLHFEPEPRPPRFPTQKNTTKPLTPEPGRMLFRDAKQAAQGVGFACDSVECE